MSIKFFKRTILLLFGITIIAIIILTYQAIHETQNWAWFKMDYSNKDQIISSYGTLIGGVLAFLSILFVLLQVYEQREQILNEKNEQLQTKIEEHENIFKLLSSFLSSIISDIKNQGINLKEFYEEELINPTLSNQAFFTVNKNFNRIIEMDYSSIYKSFEHFFSNNKEWEKIFLNFYRSIDFYKDMTPHLQENYRSQIQEKTKLKYEIQNKIQNLLQVWNEIRNKYIINFTLVHNPNYILWFQPINKYFNQYKEYIDYMEHNSNQYKIDPDSKIKPLDSNLTDLRVTYFEPFFQEMLILAQKKQIEIYGEIKLLDDLGIIITQIKNLENFALNYAKDVKKNVNTYYTDKNEQLNKLESIKEQIDDALKKKV